MILLLQASVHESFTQKSSCRFSSTEKSNEISFVSARKARRYSEKEKKAALLIQVFGFIFGLMCEKLLT